MADATVYESEQMGLAGNKVDLDHQFPTDTIGNKLEILLINHEDCACGGLSELRIFAKLPTEQESDPSTPRITATPPPTQPLPTPTPLPPTHFIAVGDRPVALSASPVFHYSLEYWQCGGDFKPLNHTAAFTPAQIVAKCKALNPTFQPKKLGEVELLARMGWEVWAGVNEVFGSGRLWIKQDVWISEIVYKGTAATELMPIYTGNAAAVQAKWATITGIANNYPWAEQSGFSTGPTFTQWPGSMYKSFQTNSNTFVRHLVTKSGLTMSEMDGLHPGNNTPSQNTETDLGRTLTFYTAHTPWGPGSPAKPEPPGTPP